VIRLFVNAEPRRGAYGGANAFLRTLLDDLRRRGVSVTSDPSASVDVALVNALTGGVQPSDLERLAERGIPVVHRKTGYRGRGAPGLRAVVAGVVLGDAHQIALSPFVRHTVFQSGYSRDVFVESGFAGSYSIVPNGVDEAIFNTARQPRTHVPTPVRVIVSTWSTDETKGFRYYREIDRAFRAADDVRLELVGRVPSGTQLRSFRVHRARGPKRLAALLRERDVLLHLTEHESCSNALIEGLNCGLPAVFLASGANAEVAGDFGVPWAGDLREALAQLMPRYGEIVARLPANPFRISLVGPRYLEILEAVAEGREPAGAGRA
jgi:hypothetical protein